MTSNDVSCTRNHNVQQFKDFDSIIQDLLRAAVEIRNFSYSPYSNFKVGAAVLCEDGSIFGGCNIENAAYPVALCAEKNAYGKAISSGKNKFIAVAVIGYQEKSFTTPCGNCRQFMSEFGDVDVYVSKPALDDVLKVTLKELLPHQFVPVNYSFS